MRSLGTNRGARASAFIILGMLTVPGKARAQADQSPQSGTHIQARNHGFTAKSGEETIQVIVCSENVEHVVASPGNGDVHGASPAQPWMLNNDSPCPGARFKFAEDADGASITTSQLHIKYQSRTNNLVYSTIDGTELLRERPAEPRTYESSELNGVKSLTVEDRFVLDITEGIFGLGQHQDLGSLPKSRLEDFSADQELPRPHLSPFPWSQAAKQQFGHWSSVDSSTPLCSPISLRWALLASAHSRARERVSS